MLPEGAKIRPDLCSAWKRKGARERRALADPPRVLCEPRGAVTPAYLFPSAFQFSLFKNPLASRGPGWISAAASSPVLGTLWMHSLSWAQTEMDESSPEQAQLAVLVLSLRESRCTWLLRRAFSASVCLAGLTVRGSWFNSSPSQSPRVTSGSAWRGRPVSTKPVSQSQAQSQKGPWSRAGIQS